MEELLKAVVSKKSDKNFSITMILVKEGVTEKYYKPGTNLDTHVDVSCGH